MKTKAYAVVAVSLLISLAACKNEDNEKKADNVDAESVQAINEMMAHQAGTSDGYAPSDSGLINAMAADKTTISIKNLDAKDTSYASLYKIVYMGESGGKMAVVYGIKRPGKMGTAIVQKEGEQTFETLPQTKSISPLENEFGNENTTLVTNDDVVTLTINGNKEVFKQIR